jgi:hypothetical protein
VQCDDVGTVGRVARCLSLSHLISQAEPNRTPCRPEFAPELKQLGLNSSRKKEPRKFSSSIMSRSHQRIDMCMGGCRGGDLRCRCNR